MNIDKDCFRDSTGRKIYTMDGKSEIEAEKKLCPECLRWGNFQVTRYTVHDCETDNLLNSDMMVYCGYGCELENNKSYVPTLNKQALKREIMNSRARIVGDSLEVYNESDNPYLHGFNCLYIHWQAIEGGYSVFYDFYLEHGYQGRDKEVGKKEMLSKPSKPTSKEAKELLYAWMIERFEAMTNGK